MYTTEEFKEKMTKILENNEDVGLVSEILTDVLNNYSEVLVNVSGLEDKNHTLAEHNASLVKANGALFMQKGIGQVEEKAPIEEEETLTLEEILSDVIGERGKLK